mmetsp:Transcript_16126/g.25382  ORF Transcript_16126/g.25382 Transcript_16126/m.25382 type:complete len:215 (-) Transcript_16126:38-682(-)
MPSWISKVVMFTRELSSAGEFTSNQAISWRRMAFTYSSFSRCAWRSPARVKQSTCSVPATSAAMPRKVNSSASSLISFWKSPVELSLSIVSPYTMRKIGRRMPMPAAKMVPRIIKRTSKQSALLNSLKGLMGFTFSSPLSTFPPSFVAPPSPCFTSSSLLAGALTGSSGSILVSFFKLSSMVMCAVSNSTSWRTKTKTRNRNRQAVNFLLLPGC